ncbi:MAG: FHA domain-containing protein [Roseiflexaceae bacterium]|jgi:hypothetical protein
MNDLANLSIEFIIWVLRLILVGLVYLFVWRVMRVMMKGSQHDSLISDLGAYLVVSDPGKSEFNRGQTFILDVHSTIGKHTNNLIVISDSYVSDNHAVIQFIDDSWIIRDLNSTNSTYINNLKVVNPVVIAHNDIISIGSVKFRMFIQTEEDKLRDRT